MRIYHLVCTLWNGLFLLSFLLVRLLHVEIRSHRLSIFTVYGISFDEYSSVYPFSCRWAFSLFTVVPASNNVSWSFCTHLLVHVHRCFSSLCRQKWNFWVRDLPGSSLIRSSWMALQMDSFCLYPHQFPLLQILANAGTVWFWIFANLLDVK